MEIDCLIEQKEGFLAAIEIKAGQSYNKDYIRNLLLFPDDIGGKTIRKELVYKGKEKSRVKNIRINTWQDFLMPGDKFLNGK